MSRPAELSRSAGQLEDAALEARGYQRCAHCRKPFPLAVSRHRSRPCPGYALTWARDTMRKNRENLRTYGGLAAMCTLTPPGVDAGLVWDRSQCQHAPEERCGQRFGCKVLPEVAALWNEGSRGWWSELNRVCKQRADRVLKRLGYDGKGGVLLYQWELQKRGLCICISWSAWRMLLSGRGPTSTSRRCGSLRRAMASGSWTARAP
jgi:hypothetical protein